MFIGLSNLGLASSALPGAKSSVNQLKFSQQFQQAPWAAQNVTVADNSILAPDGTTTGALITNTVNAGDDFVSQPVSTPLDTVFSVYVKAGTAAAAMFRMITWASSIFDQNIIFTFASNTITTVTGGVFSSYGAIDAGGGWWRLWAARPAATGQTISEIRLRPDNGSGGAILNETVNVWGAQVQTGTLILSNYMKRTT